MSVTDSPMAYLPIFIDVREARCVVVGGGAQAARKVRLLRKAGARVLVVAPALGDELTEVAHDGLIDHAARKFEPHDLDDCRLAIAAAGNIYRDIGRVILDNGYDSVNRRAYTSKPRKAWLLVTSLSPVLGSELPPSGLAAAPEARALVAATAGARR